MTMCNVERPLFMLIICLFISLFAGDLIFAESQSTSNSPGIFFGNYGYYVKLPSGYTAVAGFSNRELGIEKAVFGPKSAPQSAFQGEKLMGKYDIVSLDVTPRRTGPYKDRPLSLNKMRELIDKSLSDNGEKFSFSDVKLSLPAFKVTISSPFPLTQICIQGKEVIYLFTAGKDGEALATITNSLKEIDTGK